MADGSGDIVIRSIASIGDVDACDWDAIACTEDGAYNPFVSHAYLSAVEQSQSAIAQTGWAPHHLLVSRGNEVLGGAPVYAKSHSQGEYVFDHHWADAYHRAGGDYYPKLLCAAPFTPVTGPRLLAKDETIRNALAHGLGEVTRQLGVSSLHVNFTQERDQTALEKAGFLHRTGEQYHWFNDGYETFDDFLNALSSRKRKTIRRERRDAVDNLIIKHYRGDEITERHWDAFWLFYQDTGARKWGTPYLTRSFFSQIAESMPDDLLLICAERGDDIVAGALNFIGGDALYGRYWGCIADFPFLHFEICYYQAIDFAITNKLSRVEAGAQGQHKIARGYQPIATHSAHFIRDSGFSDAIERYLVGERDHTDMEIEALKDFTPFRKS